MRVKKVDAEILAQQSDVSEDVVSTTKDAKEKEAQEKRARQARNLAIADRMIEEHNFRSTLPNLHEVAAQTCDDMARISAALGTYLGFLDLKNETNPDSAGQHALLSPIKDQLEQSGRRLSAVL